MSKIVFFCIPAHGHTNPTLGVVRELVSRGHQVWYYSYNIMREKIEAAGATFVSCDAFDAQQRVDPKDAARLGKDLAFSTKLLVDTTLALDETVCSHMADLRPDCIVADSMAVWGKAVALKLGIPFVSSTTTFAFNQHSAKIMKQSIGQMLGMILSMPKINRDIKRLQDSGYPINSVLDILQNDNDTHTIVYASPMFQPCAETFSDKYAFVGPSIRPARERIEKKREKRIYLSMGTVNNDMLPLYRKCIHALGNEDYELILSVGSQVKREDFGQLPENVQIFEHVDQVAVLQETDVFITHCGMNSVSEALYYGVPLVMLPQTSEQSGVAQRVRQLEAGILLKKPSASAIAEAVRSVQEDPKYRKQARLLAEDFRKCSGSAGAADKILQVIQAAE